MFNPKKLKKPDFEERSIAPADSDAPGCIRSFDKCSDDFFDCKADRVPAKAAPPCDAVQKR